MNKTRLFALLTLVGLTLSGCSNPTDAIIEEAKDDSWFVEGHTYEERFDIMVGMSDSLGATVEGYSQDEKVIVVKMNFDLKENYERYDGWTLKEVHDHFVIWYEGALDMVDLHDVTVYVEYYMDAQRIALGEITTRDSDLTLD